MKKALAEYIISLSNCLAQTKQANDRQFYQMYLADAGVILASLELGIDTNKLVEKVENHERLLGWSWVEDFEVPSDTWLKFKKLL
jgi:hypothetical protein